jgi:hypothetical protein
MFGRYGGAPPRVAQKRPLVECFCTAFSGVFTGGLAAAVPHGPYAGATENRFGRRRRGSHCAAPLQSARQIGFCEIVADIKERRGIAHAVAMAPLYGIIHP